MPSPLIANVRRSATRYTQRLSPRLMLYLRSGNSARRILGPISGSDTHTHTHTQRSVRWRYVRCVMWRSGGGGDAAAVRDNAEKFNPESGLMRCKLQGKKSATRGTASAERVGINPSLVHPSIKTSHTEPEMRAGRERGEPESCCGETRPESRLHRPTAAPTYTLSRPSRLSPSLRAFHAAIYVPAVLSERRRVLVHTHMEIRSCQFRNRQVRQYNHQCVCVCERQTFRDERRCCVIKALRAIRAA